jgi:hypothetical protein
MKRQSSAMTASRRRGTFVVGSRGRLWPSARVSAAVLMIAAGVAFCAGVAQAEVPRLISDGTFSDAGAFGVAVDQSSGDVYVASLITKEFSLGESEEADESGKLLVKSPFAAGHDFGVAVNPVNRDVFVANAGSQEIEVYGPNGGVLISSFPVELGSLFEKSQIATDSAGNVYAPDPPENKVVEYSEVKPGEWKVKSEFTGGSEALSGPLGVAVDSSGNVWVADTGGNQIEELSPADKPEDVIKSEGVQSVALDASGDVFALVHNSTDFCGSAKPPCGHLVEYSPAGAQLADVGAGHFGIAELPLPLNMVAVNESSGRVYVTDGAKNLVWMFVPPTKPAVEREFTAEMGTSEAKLGALIKPGGIQATYRFEYGSTEEYGQQTPFPEGSAGEGLTANTVWAAAKGLAPGTTYHYRVVAINALGVIDGPDQTFTTATAEEVCSNDQFRTGFSASLPDCRAYELVTPSNTASAQPDTEGAGGSGGPVERAAVDGSRMSFNAEVHMGAASAGLEYVSTRGSGGWSPEAVLPLQSYTGDRCTIPGFAPVGVEAYSADLTKAILYDGHDENVGSGSLEEKGGCGAEGVEVVPGEPLGVENLLLRDDTTGSYRLVNTPAPGITPQSAHFVAASSDLSHVIFTEHAQLVAGAAAGGVENLYEWNEGGLSLPMKLNNGTLVAGSFTGISPNGSEVFFTYEGDLYARVSGASTVQLDASQAGGSGGGGQLQRVAVDGSMVFFTDDASKGLTADTVANSGTNLYSYDVSTGQLSDLTPAAQAEVGGVGGTSQDGSDVYFVAKGVLAANSREYENAEGNTVVEKAEAGKNNLYLYDGRTTTFITFESGEVTKQVASPNGAYLAFTAGGHPTGYDNAGNQEIYLYSAAGRELACVSCQPSGEPPSAGGATLSGSLRGLFDNGRLFFQTAEALLPRDTNSQGDVYEYEDGQAQLISAGTSSTASTLLEASENGEDVFFLTQQKLLPRDTNEEAFSIYDARVDGGFPESSSQSCTTPEACRGSTYPQPSIYGAPASQTFSGVGNLAPPPAAKPAVKPKPKVLQCRKGFVKRKVKRKAVCVKSKARKASRSAHANRKTGK